MKNKKVSKLLAASALTGMMLTTAGCNTQDIIDNFNPRNNIPMPAYGMFEKFNFADVDETTTNGVIDNTIEEEI